MGTARLCFLLCVVLCLVDAPGEVNNEVNITAAVGQQKRVDCKINETDFPEDTVYLWKIASGVTFIEFSKGAANISDNYKKHVRVQSDTFSNGDCTFFFENVSEELSGTYKFFKTSPEKVLRTVHLSVQEQLLPGVDQQHVTPSPAPPPPTETWKIVLGVLVLVPILVVVGICFYKRGC